MCHTRRNIGYSTSLSFIKIRRPFWTSKDSYESSTIRLLLANPFQRCYLFCEAIWQVPSKWEHIKEVRDVLVWNPWVEFFDVWGMDVRESFVPSNSNLYILAAVDNVSKWFEAQVFPTNDAKVVIRFLKKNIFIKFGT